jgi:hypothetical protein
MIVNKNKAMICNETGEFTYQELREIALLEDDSSVGFISGLLGNRVIQTESTDDRVGFRLQADITEKEVCGWPVSGVEVDIMIENGGIK